MGHGSTCQSIAYTDDRHGRVPACSPRVGKFSKKAGPAPYPCKRTAGAGEELQGKVEVIDKALVNRFLLPRTTLELKVTAGWSGTSERECGGRWSGSTLVS